MRSSDKVLCKGDSAYFLQGVLSLGILNVSSIMFNSYSGWQMIVVCV